MITDEELSRELLKLKVIWFGMLGALAIYLFIGLQIATNLKASMDERTYAVLKPVLYIFTLVALIVTRYLKSISCPRKANIGRRLGTFSTPHSKSTQLP